MPPITLKDNRTVHLGRIRPKAIYHLPGFIVRVNAKDEIQVIPKLAQHYNAAKDTAPPAATIDWTPKAMASINRMYMNDTLGCCVISGKYHIEGVASGNESGTPVLATDAEVTNAYHTICGAGDNGCDIVTVLNHWKTNGLIFNGVTKKIDDFVGLDWTNQTLVQVALEVFGNIILGINLPQAWTCTGCIWDVPTGAGAQIVGGHDVPGVGAQKGPGVIAGFTAEGVLIATWAGLVLITWPAFLSKNWIEEAYVCLPQDWYSLGGLAPNGIDGATLKADLQKVAGGVIPDPGPIVPPGPGPSPLPPAPSGNLALTLTGMFPSGIFGHMVPVTMTGTATPSASVAMGTMITIPPWLLAVLRIACAAPIPLPGIWGIVVHLLCGLLPANAEMMVRQGQSLTITLPPWALMLLRLACQEATLLPAPYNQIAAGICALLPASAAQGVFGKPCGCQ
jgi:hypothetical protein